MGNVYGSKGSISGPPVTAILTEHRLTAALGKAYIPVEFTHERSRHILLLRDALGPTYTAQNSALSWYRQNTVA